MSTSVSKQGIISVSGNTNPNLMPNSYIMPYGSASPATGTWRNAGTSTMTRSRVLIGNGMYGFQNVGVQTANDGSCYGMDSFPTEANTDYVISMYARLVSGTGGYAGYNIYSAAYVNGSDTKVDKNYRVTPLTNEWTRCWLHFKTNSAVTRNLYIGITTGDTSVTTQMCMIKLEKGSRLTPWTPYVTDNMYISASVGFNEVLYYPIGSIAENTITANQFYEI